MKNIPLEYTNIVMRSCKQMLMGIDLVTNMTIDEQINFIAQIKENEHIKKMLESKSVEELMQDAEIQQALLGMKRFYEQDKENILKVLEILEAE